VIRNPVGFATGSGAESGLPVGPLAQVQLDPGDSRGRPDLPEIVRLDPRNRNYDQDVQTYVGAVLANVREYGLRNGFPVAAGMVQMYQTNRDPHAVLTVSGRWLFGLPTVWTKGLDKNLARFEAQVRQAATKLKPGQSVRLRDHWDAQILSKEYKQAFPNTDHYPALGSFTVRSDADLVVAKDAQGRVQVTGGVKTGLVDRYDWNNPVVIHNWETNQRIEVNARDFHRFEQLGRAVPFDVRSSPVTSVAVIAPNGRITWRTVDESGKTLERPTRAPAGRSGGGFSG
jgi:hypothetical protein